MSPVYDVLLACLCSVISLTDAPQSQSWYVKLKFEVDMGPIVSVFLHESHAARCAAPG